MAGIVRQPIDLQSLERYISKNVPEIEVPIDLKQVALPPNPVSLHSLLANSNGSFIVWIRTIEPDIPTHG